MSESIDNTTSNASERPAGKGLVLTLSSARGMLPLVRSITRDVVEAQRGLDRLQPEQDRLYRRRLALTWPERERRYQIEEELAHHDRNLKDALSELAALGVELLDLDQGSVGFPTIIDGRRAFFAWRPEDDGLRFWHFAGESIIHPIPPTWDEEAADRLSRLA